MCDGYSGYNKLKKAKQTTCWSHVRRYLLDAIPKGKRMEKALTYIQNRRSDMMTYLEDGRCSFCNNLSEIEVKPVALGRKNYLFSDTTAGADSSAVIYSLVETAKANGLNMYHYLW